VYRKLRVIQASLLNSHKSIVTWETRNGNYRCFTEQRLVSNESLCLYLKWIRDRSVSVKTWLWYPRAGSDSWQEQRYKSSPYSTRLWSWTRLLSSGKAGARILPLIYL